jgi:hypothetical protein
MGEFFDAALAFPAVLCTFLLAVLIGYWLLVLLGVFDLDEDGADLLAGLGFGGVPAVVALSLVVIIGWFACLVGTVALAGLPTGPRLGLGLVVLFVAIFLGLFVTRLFVTPLRRIFQSGPPASRSDFVGRTCVIRTGSVAADFGQAEVHAEDGSSAIVQVRQSGQDDLRAGTLALIYEYDVEGEFFWVAPIDTHLKG